MLLPGLDTAAGSDAPATTDATAQPASGPTFIRRELNGVTVLQLKADGYINGTKSDNYINGTAICTAAGKLIGTWRNSAAGKYAMAETSARVGRPEIDLYSQRFDGSRDVNGTWIHPELAIHLAWAGWFSWGSQQGSQVFEQHGLRHTLGDHADSVLDGEQRTFGGLFWKHSTAIHQSPQGSGHGLQSFGLDQPFAMLNYRVHARMAVSTARRRFFRLG